MKLDISRVYDFISPETIAGMEKETTEAIKKLHAGTGAGNDYLGWLNLPNEITDQQLDEMEEAAQSLREKSEVLVVVGIGGSYLGSNGGTRSGWKLELPEKVR